MQNKVFHFSVVLLVGLFNSYLFDKYYIFDRIFNVISIDKPLSAEEGSNHNLLNRFLVSSTFSRFALTAEPDLLTARLKDSSDSINSSLNSKTYLLVKINNGHFRSEKNLNLRYNENNILFKVIIPEKNLNKIFLKYWLKASNYSLHENTEQGDRYITFNSLPPGDYNFKVFISDYKTKATISAIDFSFVILSPWWNTIWLKAIVVTIIFFTINYIIISYYINKIAFKKAFYDQLESIKFERQRISSEIHDDIGSGLFAINLFADLASKRREDVAEIKQISNMVNEISDRIREIIWSTNVENDNLENLLYYLQFQIEKLFEHSSIKFSCNIPEDIPELNIDSQSRKNLYLIIKELAHNALKHSLAENVNMNIKILDKNLRIHFKDDGIGFDPLLIKKNAMGIENVQLRVRSMTGTITISNNNGVSILMDIPIMESMTVDFKRNVKKWQLFLFKFLRKTV